MYGNVPTNELQIYTWQDATLHELTSLVRDVNPDTRKKGTYFDFAIVFPNFRNNHFQMREIGVTCTGQKGIDDNKTLAQAKFSIGDFLDISITPPNRMPPARRQRPYWKTETTGYSYSFNFFSFYTQSNNKVQTLITD